MKTVVDFVLHRYRAKSWTADNGSSVATEEYPGKFYLAEDVEPLLDRLKAAHDFDVRRLQALSAFYVAEIDRLGEEIRGLKSGRG